VLTVEQAEELLVREAFLLDERRYREWLELFTDDGIYWIPGDDPDLDPDREVSIVYDDADRRLARVTRLEHRSNWRDDPSGRLMHQVSNVLVQAGEDDSDAAVRVHSNQVIHHARRGSATALAARCTHDLRQVDGVWRIRTKRVCLLAADAYLMPGSIVLL